MYQQCRSEGGRRENGGGAVVPDIHQMGTSKLTRGWGGGGAFCSTVDKHWPAKYVNADFRVVEQFFRMATPHHLCISSATVTMHREGIKNVPMMAFLLTQQAFRRWVFRGPTNRPPCCGPCFGLFREPSILEFRTTSRFWRENSSNLTEHKRKKSIMCSRWCT